MFCWGFKCRASKFFTGSRVNECDGKMRADCGGVPPPRCEAGVGATLRRFGVAGRQPLLGSTLRHP